MHTAMRLGAFVLLLVAGILQLSVMRDSRETAVDVLNGVLPELAEMDFYPHPHSAPAVETITEFDDHWLQQYTPIIFQGVESIHLLTVRKSEPVGRDYYPDAVLEIWVYESDGQPERAIALLDSLQNESWIFKSPSSWWSHDDWMVYTHTRAEMFRPYFEEITRTLRESL